MIVVETTLRQIFSQIPDWEAEDTKSYPIRYEWGSHKDLLLYLQQQTGNKYPLIWLESNRQKVYRNAHKVERQLRLFLAKNTEHKGARNPTIWDTEFANCLNPLLDKVIKCFERSGVTTLSNDAIWEEERVANFTDQPTKEEKNYVTDIWNVIVLDIFVVFNEKATGEPNCINTIKF